MGKNSCKSKNRIILDKEKIEMKSIIKWVMIFFGGLYLWEKRETIKKVVCKECPNKDIPEPLGKSTQID